MSVVALTYGSFGDLLETARLAIKIVRFLWDGRKMSCERLALVSELRTLNDDLVNLNLILWGMHFDPSSISSSIILRILSEVEKCRIALVQLLDKLSASRGVFGAILAAISEESQLAEFRTQLSRPLKTISTLMLTLNLAVSQGVGLQVEQIGDRLLAAYQETVLKLPIARGVRDDHFSVVDPVGGCISIALRYCRVYSDMDRIVKAYLANRPEAGDAYVQRGDYEIVSGEGDIIRPIEFTRTIQAGMQVEMSIIKRQFQRQLGEMQCPHCHRNNIIKSENGWFTCSNLPCGRKYRIDSQHHDNVDGFAVADTEDLDATEIVSPQVTNERLGGKQLANIEEFRMIHIYKSMKPFSGHLELEGRLCRGCRCSVVTEQGDLVVAFGSSVFHVDCFKCGKCGDQVTADTNLVLLSDGSPICLNCSHHCNVCHNPILDEVIMSKDSCYHLDCFRCRVCKNRIDELVFAKTSQAIYCMACHNKRMEKIKKHVQRKAERERVALHGSTSPRDSDTSY